jgi:hypothetical protein
MYVSINRALILLNIKYLDVNISPYFQMCQYFKVCKNMYAYVGKLPTKILPKHFI